MAGAGKNQTGMSFMSKWPGCCLTLRIQAETTGKTQQGNLAIGVHIQERG
jgi:hypothetical protein